MRHTVLAFAFGVCASVGLLLLGATPPAADGGMEITATTANVGSAGSGVRIEILRWSTSEERDRLMAAWNLKSAPSIDAGAKGKGKAGKGAAKGAPAARQVVATPEASLTQALQETATVGYLWSSETSGYALRFAAKVENPDGSHRILLLTQRRLGAMNQSWTPVSGTPNSYEFSAIELRLNAKGDGAGTISLTGSIAPDPNAKIVAIENYNALPVVFTNARILAAQDGSK